MLQNVSSEHAMDKKHSAVSNSVFKVARILCIVRYGQELLVLSDSDIPQAPILGPKINFYQNKPKTCVHIPQNFLKEFFEFFCSPWDLGIPSMVCFPNVFFLMTT